MPTVRNLYHRPTKHRDNIISMMRKAGAHSEANRLENCSTVNDIHWDVTDSKVIIASQRCNSRWCPVCGRIRRDALHDRLVFLIKKYGHEDLRFVTITQRDYGGETLWHAGDRFRASLGKLLKRKFWKTLVKAEYIRYEADYNVAEKRWHYHAHLLVHGRYIPVQKLREQWTSITKDSYLIDVRKIDSEAPFELAKYITKLRSRGFVPLKELTEYCQHHQMYAFHGAFGKDAPPDSDLTDHHEMVYMGTITQFVYMLDINYINDTYTVICQELYKRRDDFSDLSKWFIDIIEDYIIRAGLEAYKAKAKS